MSEKTYGILAEFDSPAAILSAAEKIRDAGYSRWDVFTPFPIHGMDRVMGLKNSLVGWVSLLMGGGAFMSVVGLIWFANAFDYPLIVGGKPMFSVPMTFVPSYIMMILGAAVGALIGMLAFNELPRFHHPLFTSERFELVSRDKFMLLVGSTDPKFSETETRKLLESIGGAHIEIIED
jgi:heme A synthase